MRLRIIESTLLVVATFFCWSFAYAQETDYHPRVFEKDGLVDSTRLNTKEHYDRVERVLRYYKVQFERTGETSLRLEKPIDRDLMWNYTTKAEDQKWLAAHVIKPET